MKSKSYIIAWDGCLDNCLDIHSQLSGKDIDYVFYNVSSTDIESENWIRSEDIRYYGHVYNGLKDFVESDLDIYVFNAGDPSYKDYAGFTKRLENLFESDPDIWAYAPSINVDVFSGINLQPSSKHKGLYLTCMTNGIYFALNRNLAILLYEYMDWAIKNGYIKLKTMTSGWGIDVIFCGLALYHNKKIYRDTETFLHPAGSTYSGAVGANEYQIVIRSFLEYSSSKGYDSEKLRRLFEKIIQSAYKDSNQLDVKDFYSNLISEV
jgi:predicted nucleotidyltransferase